MTCPDPPSVANGYISSNTSTSVTYACNDGFGLSGYAQVLCSGGAWGTLPYCYTSWNRNNNNFIATGNVSSTLEEPEATPDYIIYGVYGAVGSCILALLAGCLLCWLHQCGCYDGPAVGFGGSYVYSDRRCCYWGDLNVNCCNFQCSCCKRRCCRYVRKKSHGKVHFQTTPTPEHVALQKFLMKKKRKRRFGPIPCCLRAGRCLLGCLLCCCRWKRRKAKLAKQLEKAEEEKLLSVIVVQETKDEESNIINVQPMEGNQDGDREKVAEKTLWATPKPEEDEKKKVPEKKAEPIGPPLMAIREAPTKPRETKPEPEKEKVKKAEPVGPPLMVIRAPPPKPKKKKRKEEKKGGFESTPAPDFAIVVASTKNPFGNVDVKPSKRAGISQTEANGGQLERSFPVGKGNKVSSSPSANVIETNLTFDKNINKKVSKWTDMNDEELWRMQPQQNLFSPEAPIKTRKTAGEMIPLASLFKISGAPKPVRNQKKPEKKRKEDEGDNFGLPSVGSKRTVIPRLF
ncbi:hypothetical protein KP79_PYT11634 [Mizuhopecten yessoensis]|uniref:Sushi domain-containing protein n=1 Tax=Mizuhopecten yessoensis TaxID=6573 RepID=A0A210R4L0_MIZYE|nr:hypothetical protein KP79_PYT11634 [Mizuhopecten yessoensis]